tara:strand:- start:221 stop:721 length:501 start_codon:yes stop_codon:yes gene_type:complete
MKRKITSFVVVSLLLISSCGSSDVKVSNEVVEPAPKAQAEKVWEEFTLGAVGNTMMDMKYSLKNITVKEGSWVRIILENQGSDPAMIHNILFITYGKRADLALSAVEAGLESNYIPKSKDVIAASGLAQPGETVTLEFEAPKKGNYEFFCSYPGHSTAMRGYFFVK